MIKMEAGMMQNAPGDSRMIDKIVHQLKSQGIFDQFRKECIADVDTKPAYQNLHQRVEGSVSGFLASQVWRPDLNKNQLRDSLRKHIHESGFLDIGVERIVDQVVNPKILTVFMPQVEDVVYKFLGIEKPKKGKGNQTVSATPSAAGNVTWKEERKLPTLTDLLPKELEPISPESDTLKDEEYNSDEDGEVGFPNGKEEEDSSPPFEPIEEVNSRLGESSMDSHLSGISELTSHDSQHSHASFLASNPTNNDSSPPKLSALDISNNDSELSRVSSGSRLSIVSGCEQDCRLSHDIEGSNDSQQSKTSLLVSGQGTQMPVSIEFAHEENAVKDADSHAAMDNASEESSIYANRWQTSVQSNVQNVSDDTTANKNPKIETSDQEEQRLDERSEKEVGDELEKKCEDARETKLTEEYENESEIFGHKCVENEDEIWGDKFENKLDEDSNRKKTDETLEEKHERKIDEKTERIDQSDEKAEVQCELKLEDVFVKEDNEKCERMVGEKHGKKSDENLDKKSDDRCESKFVENFEIRFTERSERKSNEKCERKLDDKPDRKLDEKSARKLDEKYEKSDDSLERKLIEKPEIEFSEKSEWNFDEASEQKLDEETERKSDHKSEKKSDEKLGRKMVEKHEKKYDDKSERKVVEKCERRSDEKSEKKLDEKFDRKLVEKLEKKIDEKCGRKCDERPEQKLGERAEKKSDDKSEKKSDEIFERKSDDKAEKRLADKSEKKLDLKLEKKTDRSEKKVEDKHDKKQNKHRDDREKFREKKGERKRLGSESRDLRKNDIGGHSSVGEKKRSDKDRHKKERGDSRSRAEKSIKDGKENNEKAGSKEKLQHEEKSEKSVMKDKCEQEVKETKDEKEKDCSKDKSKKDDGNILRHDKGSKKSKSDEKRQRDGKEKLKSEEKVRMKHDDKHKDRTKFESRDKSDKDKSVRHGYKNSKDGNRSDSKESKDRMKQEAKDKGKGTASKSEEKKSKDKSKHEEKTGKIVDKGSTKKGDKKNTEMNSNKLSHTNHKNKDTGKKDKENKGKTVTDDHRIYRDKRSDDRRSTDRDSNGTARDRPVGSTSSRTNVNDSQRTQSHRDKSGSNSNSTKSDGGGSSDSSGANTLTTESSKNIENIFSSSKSSSPPSSLPFKKRPVAVQSEDEYELNHSGSGKLTRNKIKKPKIAANIFEVKKIMMLRKSLAKKERKQQRELKKKNIRGMKEMKSGKKMTKPMVAKRRKLGDVEKSLRNEVDTSLSNKQTPDVEKEEEEEGEEDSEQLKYFDPELFPSSLSSADSDFLAYVKELLKSENLSELATSDSRSEASDMGHVIHLPGFYLDNIVATELGAKLVETDKGTEVLLDLPEEKELSKKALSSLNSSISNCLPMANKGFTGVGSCKITASRAEPVVLIDQCEYRMSHSTDRRTNVRSVSALSTSSCTSDDTLRDRKAKRILRQRSSSVTSTNSNKSTSDRTEVASNGLGVGKVQHSGPKLHRKREFLKERVKTVSVCETKTPEVMVEKQGFQRSHRPSAQYSNKIFSSYMEDEDLSHDAFSEERENIIMDDEFSLITHNDISKNVPDRASRLSPILSGQNKVFFTRMKIPATITQADDDSSDREVVSAASAADPYDIIKDNNNIDKGSSEDERGCGDVSMLNQDLILPTLRDLMVESGFTRQDDNSNILSSLIGVENSVGNSLQVTGSNVGSVRGVHEAKKGAETRRPKLGRSRRVGLGRPVAKKLSEQGGGYDPGNKTPPSSTVADFVMPLSPESDISASSGEAKKPVLDPKVGDNYTDPSPSSSDKKDGQMSDSRLDNTEIRRSLRSGGIGTPGGRAQRYDSDDLYKPRPLFSQCSRRVRGQVSPSLSQEAVTNCTGKRHTSDVTETHSTSTKRRR